MSNVMSKFITGFFEQPVNNKPALGIKLLDPQAQIPHYSHPGDSGMDIYASQPQTIKPEERKLIKTGIALEIPVGYEVQIRSRSGLALKHGIAVLNSPATIDQGYKGEIGVILINHGQEDYWTGGINAIAQIVICKVDQADIKLVRELSDSSRGDDAYGSTDYPRASKP